MLKTKESEVALVGGVSTQSSTPHLDFFRGTWATHTYLGGWVPCSSQWLGALCAKLG